MGTGRYLKEHRPSVKVVAVEPPIGERVEGLRNLDDGYIPPVFDLWHGQDLLDRKRVVRPRESIEWTRRLVQECGVFAGLSSYPLALVGALGVGLLESFSSFWASAFKEVIVFASILPVLLWRSLRDPHGEEH